VDIHSCRQAYGIEAEDCNWRSYVKQIQKCFKSFRPYTVVMLEEISDIEEEF